MGLQRLREYLHGLPNKTSEEVKEEINHVPSLQCKGMCPDGRFAEYIDHKKRKRVKVHPSDPVTVYPHVHIYDSVGNSLTEDLAIGKENSPETHLKLKE